MRKLTALVLVVSSLAFAQTEAPKPKAQEVTFENGSDIDGRRQSPLNSYIVNQRKSVFKNLIKVRADFNDKLAASVHEM